MSVRKSVLTALAFGALALAAQAQITFTVNEFTADKLVVTINPGTLLTTGGANETRKLSLVDSDETNTSWVNSNVTGTGGGAFGTASQSLVSAEDSLVGDWVYFEWSTNLATAGDLVTGITYTFEGVGAFTPANVTSWALYWGDPLNPIFTLQSTGSAETGGGSSPIPEPSSFAALAGFAVLGLAATRRRHQRA